MTKQDDARILVLDKINPLETEVITRDGREASLLAIDFHDGNPRDVRSVVARVKTGTISIGESIGHYYLNGRVAWNGESNDDLINFSKIKD